MKRDEIFHHVESLREEMVELQKELTRRPALGPESGGQGEKEKADFLKAWIVQNLKKAEVRSSTPRIPGCPAATGRTSSFSIRAKTPSEPSGS